MSGAARGTAISLSAARAADLRPTSMRAASFSIEITRPLMTVPSRPLATPSDSSSSAAKLSFGLSSGGLSSAVSVATAIPSPRSQIVGSGPAGIAAERAAGGERARPHRPGPADRRYHRISGQRWLAAIGGKDTRDNVGSLLEHLVGVEPCRIDRNGIGRCRKRSDPTQAVARVAFLHVLQDILVYSRRAALPQLFDPALGARRRAGRDKQLHRGIGADHRADAAAIDNRASRACRRGPPGSARPRTQPHSARRRAV